MQFYSKGKYLIFYRRFLRLVCIFFRTVHEADVRLAWKWKELGQKKGKNYEKWGQLKVHLEVLFLLPLQYAGAFSRHATILRGWQNAHGAYFAEMLWRFRALPTHVCVRVYINERYHRRVIFAPRAFLSPHYRALRRPSRGLFCFRSLQRLWFAPPPIAHARRCRTNDLFYSLFFYSTSSLQTNFSKVNNRAFHRAVVKTLNFPSVRIYQNFSRFVIIWRKINSASTTINSR